MIHTFRVCLIREIVGEGDTEHLWWVAVGLDWGIAVQARTRDGALESWRENVLARVAYAASKEDHRVAAFPALLARDLNTRAKNVVETVELEIDLGGLGPHDERRLKEREQHLPGHAPKSICVGMGVCPRGRSHTVGGW